MFVYIMLIKINTTNQFIPPEVFVIAIEERVC